MVYLNKPVSIPELKEVPIRAIVEVELHFRERVVENFTKGAELKLCLNKNFNNTESVTLNGCSITRHLLADWFLLVCLGTIYRIYRLQQPVTPRLTDLTFVPQLKQRTRKIPLDQSNGWFCVVLTRRMITERAIDEISQAAWPTGHDQTKSISRMRFKTLFYKSRI